MKAMIDKVVEVQLLQFKKKKKKSVMQQLAFQRFVNKCAFTIISFLPDIMPRVMFTELWYIYHIIVVLL